MRKFFAVITVLVFILVLPGSVLATDLDSILNPMKTTFVLGPFKIEELGAILSRSDTEVTTIGSHYGLQSLEPLGISDELIEIIGIEKLDEYTANFIAEKLKEKDVDAVTYQNAQGIYGLYYIEDIIQSKMLTIMMVHGKDCLIAVSTYEEEMSMMSALARFSMDEISLADQKTQ